MSKISACSGREVEPVIATRIRSLVRPWISALCALVVVAALATTSYAGPLDNPTDPKALDHLRLGNRHLDLEHYDQAIEEYEAGALIEPVPIFWLNIGIAHRKADRYADAARAFRTFLSKIANEPDAAEIRTQVEDIIKAMEDAASKPPTDTVPVAEAGPMQPLPQPQPGPAEPVSRLTTGRKISLFLGGGGVVALGAGVVFGIRSRGYEDDARTLCPTTACADADRANELLQDADNAASNANVAYVVGGAAVVGAAALWFLMSPEETSSTVVAAPYVSPASAGVQLIARF